jgi:hypothetical protein
MTTLIFSGPFSDEDTPDAADQNDVDVLRQVLLGQEDFAGARGMRAQTGLCLHTMLVTKNTTGYQDKPPEYRLARMLLSGLG